MKLHFKFCLFLSIYILFLFQSINIYALEENQNQLKEEQIINISDDINCYVGDDFSLDIQLIEETDLTYIDYDTSIISINQDGVVTALKSGKTQVTIYSKETDSYLSTSKTITITVLKKKQNILVDDISITYNDTKKIDVKSNYSNLQYIVENNNILEVDDDGNITTKAVGKTKVKIIALENDEFEADEKTITVEVTSSLSKPNITLCDIDSNKQEITIGWEKVDLADGYLIYCKIDSNKWVEEADVSSLQYIKTNISSSKKYQFKIIAYRDNQKDKSECSLSNSLGYLNSPTLSLSKNKNTIKIQWNQITSANTYNIYKYINKKWTLLTTIKFQNQLSYIDKNISNGNTYYYKIKAIWSYGESQYSSTKNIKYLSSPTIKSCNKSNTILTIKWNKIKNIDGYQIQYSTNSLFTSSKTITINKKLTSKQIKNLSKNSKYYVRMRTYKKYNKTNYYSCWTTSSNVSKTKKITLTQVKIDKKIIELRALSNQKLYQYDTVQGGCSDGTYVYYVLYNRKVEKCKIAKFKLSNFKLIKVSNVLNITHGNDITYNSITKKLVVLHTRVNPYRASIINPNTLKIESYKDVQLSTALIDTSTNDIKSESGLGGIAYNKKKNNYVVLFKSTGNLAILDKNMNTIKYIKPATKNKQLYQGLDITDDYILVAENFSTNKPYNIISVYDWDGNYIQKIIVKKGYELENIFHVKNQFYATFYTSYYKTYYTYKTETTVVNGKKKTVRTKIKQRKLIRDNYVYQIKNI